MTDHGQLREFHRDETDPVRPRSLVTLVNQAATAMGTPELP
jgi:hypothetical protein